MRRLLFVAALTLLGGCATKNGRCYPILGFGWVTVSTNQPSVTAVRTTLVGVGVSTLPANAAVGYSHSVLLQATTNANVNLEWQ